MASNMLKIFSLCEKKLLNFSGGLLGVGSNPAYTLAAKVYKQDSQARFIAHDW